MLMTTIIFRHNYASVKFMHCIHTYRDFQFGLINSPTYICISYIKVTKIYTNFKGYYEFKLQYVENKLTESFQWILTNCANL